MYTDPNHIRVEDPGNVEGNPVFIYLDALVTDEHFKKYLPEYHNLDELKEHYRRGGLGDVKIKKFLFEVLNRELKPIREKRIELSKDMDYIDKVLIEGTEKARIVAKENMKKFKKALRIDYFDK
jgi:tryptophanyl-tRNA synthetase